jgi:hypothetical protein
MPFACSFACENDVVTKLRSIALLVLLALALRLGAGPHPCHGAAGMPGMSGMTPKAGACHSGASHPGAPPAQENGNDCCKKGHTLCENACQTAAVLSVALPPPDHLRFDEWTPSAEDRSLPLFVPTIDHVPLS